MLSFSNIKDYLHFYCAPCLLGFKCANLFCAPCYLCEELLEQQAGLASAEFKINDRILCLEILYVLKGKACVIVYSKEEIEKLLRIEEVQDALLFFGHKSNFNTKCKFECKNNCNVRNIFEKLKDFALSNPSSQKTKERVSFPHEIGLLLGYPPQDVVQYYINSGKRYLFSGYWKVYTNPEWATSQFKKYDEARAYCVRNRVI